MWDLLVLCKLVLVNFLLGIERCAFPLQVILKQKLRGQGMAFLVGGGSGIIHFTLCVSFMDWRLILEFETAILF